MTGANSSEPARHRPASQGVTVLLPVVGLLVAAVCGLLLFGLGTARVGATAVGIGVVAATVPVAVVVATFLWIDRWEPEPAPLLLLTFVWGACVATLTALLINDTAAAVGDLLLGIGRGDKVSAIVSAPFAEEAVKAVPLLLLLWHRSREFDGVVDGIVYAGFSAAGFAFTENIYYFGRAFAEHGFGDATSPGVLAAFILRGVLSPFTHPLFSVLIGIGVGVAAMSRGRTRKVLAPLGGYVLAVGLHSLWNASATLGGGSAFINVYFLVMVPVFLGVAMLVLWQRRREERIIAAALPKMASARWIAQSEVELLASLAGRRRWRRQARRESGRRAARAVAEYQARVTELAFLRRLPAGGSERRARRDELLSRLRAARAEAVRLASEGGTRDG
ncbi:RsiW-degrading membrane proteinase PrsW (M82 family) [Prauserella shujinwangii]|uniref:RsiW-degrading membrane proteinase PrsW (M82 family) n=1 Tax=Prauserella shujinwangii TaxID=1453103 RepID=A0A2T0M1R2_9PSEU|nr:PrsW family intramembrane metalloprotease [Prauserella shujinwangii]PRX50513.1 RsiW-degrading membrane proteinase PrsW (M82 family) [Prauserella shujinwangii]